MRNVFDISRLSLKSEETFYVEGLKAVLAKLYNVDYSKNSDDVFDLFCKLGYSSGTGKQIDTSLSWLYPEIPRNDISSGVKKLFLN